MTLLPVVARELRVAARRPATYWWRAVFGLLALLLGGFVWLVNHSAPSWSLGGYLFGALAWLCLLYCLFAGVGFTADCLSEEKREGTLGLLFLTDLKGYDVILGKLAATSATGFSATVAVFPLLAMPLLLGGVTVGEFWRCTLVLALTFFFSLACGMLASTLSRRMSKARLSAFGLLLFFVGALPIITGIILYCLPTHTSRVAECLLLPCPFYALTRSQDGYYHASQARFWWSAGIIHGLSWLFLLLAALVVPASWQDRPARARGQWWRGWRHRLAYGRGPRRKARRAELLQLNPVCWLAGRATLKPALVWAALGLVAALWLWGSWLAGSEWFHEGIYYPTAILLNTILKLGIAAEAGRQFGEDRRAGTLELVLSTPLSTRQILRGQLLALRRQFLGPVLAVIAVQLIFLAASLQRESFRAQPINPVVWLAFIIMLVADIATLCWVGMWEAMTARKPTHITGKTVARILVAPWVLFVAILILTALWVENSRAGQAAVLNWEFFVGLWFVLGLLTDLAFGVASAWHLLARFRTLALRHYAPRPSLWRRWVGRRRRTDAPG